MTTPEDPKSAGARRAFTARGLATSHAQAGAVQVAMQLREELEAAVWAANLLQGVDAQDFAWAVGMNPERHPRPQFVARLTEILELMHGRARGRALTAAVLVRLQDTHCKTSDG